MDTTNDIDYEDFEDLLSNDTPQPGSPWEVGEVVTCLISGATQNFGKPFVDLSRTYTRGDVIEVTAATLDHRADVLALVDDPDAQLKLWGQQRWHRGHLDVEKWTEQGDAFWILERDQARAVAAETVDPVERAERYKAISERFGAAPTPRSIQYIDRAAQRREAEDAHLRSLSPRGVYRSSAD